MKWAAGVLDKNHSQSDQGTVMKNNKSLCIPQHILYNVSLNIAAHQIHNPRKRSFQGIGVFLPPWHVWFLQFTEVLKQSVILT